ncbi:ribokinase [Fulvimarina endophytica]|uniref:Ribokinase n=1 Tax=Fulvimarina endophytica TaxID=2293836 RepID=A0A371WY92_9HYPH|nr:PfkB family carbohydrate kinase [Fulvimarina endophytica]RFC61970.1 ribokinase [Fulvimarina endophytica]
MAPRLIHLGGAVMDYVYRVPSLPRRAAELLAGSFERLPGGAVNMMVAARRTGLATACGGHLGTGADGDRLRAFLAAEGIEVLLPPLADVDSGNCVVLVTPDAERSFVSWPGAEARADGFAALAGMVKPGDIVTVNGYILTYPRCRPAVLSLLERLEDGVDLVFDPAPVIADIPADALSAVLARATWLSANTSEIAAIEPGAALADAAARILAERMPRARGVVVRGGADGAHLLTRSGTLATIQGFAVEAIDTNGAGDTHLGSFVSALARGMEPEEAVRYANAAAAIAVTRHGGASGPGHDEILEFLALKDQDRDLDRRGTGRDPMTRQAPPRMMVEGNET